MRYKTKKIKRAVHHQEVKMQKKLKSCKEKVSFLKTTAECDEIFIGMVDLLKD